MRLVCCLLFLLLASASGSGSASATPLEEMVLDREFSRAIPLLEESLRKASGEERSLLLLLLAECQVELRQKELAEQTLAFFDPRTAPPGFFRIRGKLQVLHQRTTLARKDLRHALGLQLSSDERIRVLCELSHLENESGDIEAARSAVAEAVETASQSRVGSRELSRLYGARFALFFKAGQLQEALSICRLARIHFQDRNYRAGLLWSCFAEADIHTREGRFQAAEDRYREALSTFPEETASVLMVWGYSTLYGRDDLPALRRVLEASHQHWSEEWPEFDRYHLRMLQAQIYLHGLNDPASALSLLRACESLASPTARPSGDHVTVRLAFHEFGEATSSDIEQVLWLELRCLRLLGRTPDAVRSFMQEKTALLPTQERTAWLFTLGESYLASDPDKSGPYFADALKAASRPVRPKLLSAVLDAYLQAGQSLRAGSSFESLADELEALTDQEKLNLALSVAGRDLDRIWLLSLWQLVPGARTPTLTPWLEGATGQSMQLDRLAQKGLDDSRRGGAEVELARAYFDKARRLFLAGRFSEAAVACELAERSALKADLSIAPYRQLLSASFFQMGKQTEAVEQIRQARESFRLSSSMESDQREVDCAMLEVGYLLEMQQASSALTLLESYQARADQQRRAAFSFGRARALTLLERYDEALEALDLCQTELSGSSPMVFVKAQRAVALSALGRPAEATREFRDALDLAASLSPLLQSEVALLWHQVAPGQTPISELESAVEDGLGKLPSEYSSYLRQLPQFRQFESLAAGQDASSEPSMGAWLSRKEFLRQSSELMLRYPEMATSIPLLPGGLAAKATELQPDEMLVEYYLGPGDLVVLAAAPEGYLVRRLAVERRTLDEWTSQVTRSPEAGQQLHRILLAPLEPHIKNRTLLFAGHGPLLSLRWDLLRAPDSSLLPDHHEWRLWAVEAAPAKVGGLPAAPRILAVGGVAGSDLPASEREVEAIRQSGAGRVEVLTGNQATLREIERRLPEVDILHLATHSTPAYLQLSDAKLTLDEIHRLPIKPGALVVLSSCRGLDPANQERGPITLAAAFLSAGASQVVAGLEPVADEEAERFFGEFYRHLAQGVSPSLALRRAKQAQMSSDPAGDWSTFVLVGR